MITPSEPRELPPFDWMEANNRVNDDINHGKHDDPRINEQT
jgi:hypothetical protein